MTDTPCICQLPRQWHEWFRPCHFLLSLLECIGSLPSRTGTEDQQPPNHIPYHTKASSFVTLGNMLNCRRKDLFISCGTLAWLVTWGFFFFLFIFFPFRLILWRVLIGRDVRKEALHSSSSHFICYLFLSCCVSKPGPHPYKTSTLCLVLTTQLSPHNSL